MKDIIKSETIRKKIGSRARSLESFAGVESSVSGSRRNTNDKVLVIDKSSSMSESVGGMTKWDHLLHAINLHFAGGHAIAVCFDGSPNVQVMHVDDIAHQVRPGGGTAMEYAFQEIHRGNFLTGGKYKSIIAISDGETYNEEKAMDAAKTLGVKVDTIYIGEDDTAGCEFMKRLSKETGGGHNTVNDDEQGIRLLESAIAGLLAGPIKL